MLGVIITGHGQFASGLKGSLELIAGENPRVKDLCFLGEEGFEDLQVKLEAMIQELLSSVDRVIICCDLLGGTPFKAAVMSVQNNDSAAVVCPTNLPMLLELSLSDYQGQSFDKIFNSLVNNDMMKPQLFEKLVLKDAEEVSEEEGI